MLVQRIVRPQLRASTGLAETQRKPLVGRLESGLEPMRGHASSGKRNKDNGVDEFFQRLVARFAGFAPELNIDEERDSKK